MSQAFWYVNGDPLAGCWIDMDGIDDEDEIKSELAAKGWITETDEDGDPVYDGDLLVADANGLAKCFLGKYGSFDLSDFKDARDSGKDEDEIIAYINYAGSWSESDFDDCFQGAWDSELAFAENLFNECYLHDVPKSLRYYIDYEKFACDLFIGDYYFEDGYVFRRT